MKKKKEVVVGYTRAVRKDDFIGRCMVHLNKGMMVQSSNTQSKSPQGVTSVDPGRSSKPANPRQKATASNKAVQSGNHR